jgi:biotin carboxyl carrier protein
MKKLKVTVDGKAYEVLVEVVEDSKTAAPVVSAPAPVATPPPSSQGTSAPAVVEMQAPSPTPAGGTGEGDVLSPLAGKVVSIAVQVGEEVPQGAELLTLEAMKMNTYVMAPKAGKVASIGIKPGDAVSEGQVLVTIS